MSEDLRSLTEETLRDSYLLALGVHDESGPWVASVIFVYDEDFNIYWLSSDSARHSKAVTVNRKASGSIVAEHAKNRERALQIEGSVEKVSGQLFEQEKALRSKEGSAAPKSPGETVGGHSWYKLTPTRIELINSAMFGWDRKRVL